MTCRESTLELVECARAGEIPREWLQSHLRECPRCSERWQHEPRLAAQFQAIRNAARAGGTSNACRDQLMIEFERSRQGGFHLWLRWVLNAAAILLVAVALIYDWRSRHPAANIAPRVDVQPTSVSGAAVEDSGFVDVPYTLPLASGEFVRVIRTELDPAALARMGVDVDAADGTEIPADMLLGEDGFPRAVRVLPNAGLWKFELSED